MKTIPILSKKRLLPILFILLGNVLSAQEVLLNPTATVLDGLSTDIKTFVCPPFNIQEFAEINKDSTPLIFAKKFDTQITTIDSGQWENVNDLRVWRYRIISKDAYSMMLIFKDMKLPDDSSLFLYNEDMSYIVGPVTNNYNMGDGIYATELIPGSSIIVELVMKESSYKKDTSYFTIDNVSHDFIDVFEIAGNTNNLDKILKCHNDVNCDIGSDWQTHKRSVAFMLISGEYYCSGSLINNAAFDGKSLFLSASHCFDNTVNGAARTVFYFNYEKEKCDGPKQNYNTNDQVIKISGATEVSRNYNTDILLLKLNDRIPSSYKPYFAGWDRSNNIPTKGIIIHHPVANPKKITFDNQTLTVNTNPVLNGTFPPGTLWESQPDSGTIQRGSSGSPLFNQNGRIVGQTIAVSLKTKNFCPPYNISYFGRLSLSWDQGTSPSQRLKEHLDPNNTNQTSIQGLIPEGWRHYKFPADSDNRKVNNSPYDVVQVGLGNQIFYRTKYDRINLYYWTVAGWQHGIVQPAGSSAVSGDIAVGLGNQVFYRNTNGNVGTMYWANNTWQYGVVGGNPHIAPRSLVLGDNNDVIYRGTDDKMHILYWSNNAWQHGVISGTVNNNTKIAGDIVMGNGGQVFYRGGDGKLQMYYWGNNSWVHAYVDPAGSNASSNHNIHYAPGSISIDKNNNNTVYYRGSDNRVQRYYWTNTGWQHQWLGSNIDANVNGDISVGEGNQIFYRGTDGKMHLYYLGANNAWIHDWVETSWQAPNANNVASSLGVGPGNKLFYRGNNGFMQNYFWSAAQMLKNNEDQQYFGMDQTPMSPTIPKEVKKDLSSTLSPNPATDYIALTTKSNQQSSIVITITDVQGRIMSNSSHKTVPGENTITLNINKLSSGIYFVTLQNNKDVIAVHKLIKK